MMKEDVCNTPLVYGFDKSRLNPNCINRQGQIGAMAGWCGAQLARLGTP
jgi:hypothetical protein